jgi:DNA-binding response OmpR family regulator
MEKSVLLIDDEASLRRTVTMGLMQKGYRTEPCENGMKALQTLETFKKNQVALDCAIVDVRLPDIDGIKLLKVIKFNYPDLPVIVITGYGSEETQEEVKTYKAEAYLEKPFTMEDLTTLLAAIPPAKKAEAVEETPAKATERAESVTSYALVTLSQSANLMDVYRTLYFQENVLYCDAIRGDHDLVLLVQAESEEKVQEIIDTKIKAVAGIEDVSVLSVETPIFGESVINIMGSVDKALGKDKTEGEVYADQTARIRASSYVTLEIEKEKLEGIYPVLYFNDQVVYCDYTRGKYDIVALMKGTSFSEIENTIRNKFKPLDGVLRIKTWPIITLFET